MVYSEKCLEKFFSLVPHYFRFKYYDPNTRKDRCLDKKLFTPEDNMQVYHIERIANTATPMPLEARLKRLLQMYREKKVDLDVRHAVDVLITAIEDDGFVHTLPSSFTRRHPHHAAYHCCKAKGQEHFLQADSRPNRGTPKAS